MVQEGGHGISKGIVQGTSALVLKKEKQGTTIRVGVCFRVKP